MSRNARLQSLLLALLVSGGCAAAAALFSPATAPRVVVVQGSHLLNAYLPDEARVESAFDLGLVRLTLTTNVAAAWRRLVSTNDIVGIKVFSEPGPISGTRPAVVAAIVHGLLAAGVPGRQIIIWDKHADILNASGFSRLARSLGVRVAGAVEAGYDRDTYYLPDSPVIGTLAWGDLEFGQTNADAGKRSFVSKLVSRQMTKIISVAPLMNENDAGVCGHFFSLALGSLDNTRRFEGDPDRLAVALPEIIALPAVGDHVTLYVTDALLGQYQGGPSGYLQYSTEVDQLWLSRDPVALDVLSLQELARERSAAGVIAVPVNYEIYTNANLLQLGVNDPAQIQSEIIKAP